MADDALSEWCYEIAESLAQKDVAVFYVTGRPEEWRRVTEDWLARHECPLGTLFMRADENYDPDYLIKQAIYHCEIRDHYDVLFVIEDRARVVEMWRQEGLVALQCDRGQY